MTYRDKFVKALLILFFIGVAFGLPELFARIFLPEWKPVVSDAPSHFVPNPYTGWLHPPSSALDNRLEETVHSNRLGLRDKELGEKKRPRILFLGDSFTWGWGVNNNLRYTNRLQERLPGFDLVNAGITGFGTLQEYLLLKHFGEQIKPDYIVLQVYPNDFDDNVEPGGAYNRPYIDILDQYRLHNYPSHEKPPTFLMRSTFYLGEHTYFYRQLLIRLYGWLVKAGFGAKEPGPTPTQEELAHSMDVVLGMLYRYCADNRLPVIVFASDLEPYQKQTLQTVSKQFAVAFYDLDPAFAKATQQYRLDDHTGHWNGYGNELVANDMYPHIVSMISPAARSR